MSRTRLIFTVFTAALCFATAHAQTPAPAMVVQAAPAATAPTAPAGAAEQDSAASLAAVQLLQAMKAANEETLRKQAATLQQLDELEKAVDQLKIFSKRG